MLLLLEAIFGLVILESLSTLIPSCVILPTTNVFSQMCGNNCIWSFHDISFICLMDIHPHIIPFMTAYIKNGLVFKNEVLPFNAF